MMATSSVSVEPLIIPVHVNRETGLAASSKEGDKIEAKEQPLTTTRIVVIEDKEATIERQNSREQDFQQQPMAASEPLIIPIHIDRETGLAFEEAHNDEIEEEAEAEEEQPLTTIDEDEHEGEEQAAAMSSEKGGDKPAKRHLERRLWRRVVWGSAMSAISLGGALASLGMPNAHHRVLRRLMKVAGGLSRFTPQMPGVVFGGKEAIGGVPCRIYRPASSAAGDQDGDQAAAVIVYLHGGGWAMGSARIYHPFTQRLCRDTGAVVVSVDYRLAPENAYPVPLDDCLAATRAVLDADRNPASAGSLAGRIDVRRVVLAGDSAGGNLSGAVALELIRHGDANKLAGVLMICPVTQAVTAMHDSALKYGPRYRDGSLGYFVSLYAGVAPTRAVLDAIKHDRHIPPEQRKRWLRYVMPRITEVVDDQQGDHSKAGPLLLMDKVVELATAVRAWPLLAEDAELSQMPPTMVQTCSHDVLQSENFVFVERLRKSGAADVRHSHIERSEHCETINSMLIGSKASRQGYLEIVEFLREATKSELVTAPEAASETSC